MLNGLILCGGESSRMGSDKGTLLKNGKYWAEIMIEKISPFCQNVFVSINKNQIETYSNIFSTEILLTDTETQKGPMSGIKAYFERKIQNDILILPCDMIDFNEKLIEKLIEVYQNDTDKNCSCFELDSKLEPFPCIIKTKYINQNLNLDFGVQTFLKANQLLKIEFVGKKNDFKNYNSKDDIYHN